MDPASVPPADKAPAQRGPTRRLARRSAIAVLFVAGAAGALALFLSTEFALGIVVRMLVARSDGRLVVEEPAGSLLSAVRVKRLAWRGPEAVLTADDVALTWNPLALGSRGIVIRGLGAQRITFALHPSDGATPLPESLALPTQVVIDRIAVGRFDWSVGTSSGTITGLAFGYSGGALAHRIRALSLVAPRGTATGDVTLAATAPFAIDGKLALAGDATLKDARADVAISGTLAAVVLAANGHAGEARFTANARLAPLAAVVLESISVDATDLDLAAWDVAWPATRLSARVQARPVDGGLGGHVEATNAIPGAIDAGRVPLRALRAQFSWHGEIVRLDALSAELAGGARAAGRAQIPLTGDAGTWALDVHDLDLRQIYTPLITTRLSGTLGAELESARQRVNGEIADRTIVGGTGLSFAATVSAGKVAVERFRVRAGGGELAGRGKIDLAGAYAFELVAKASRVDASRFGAFPVSTLDGEISATGALRPGWRVGFDLALAAGSRLAGVPVSGTARATAMPRVVRDAAVDLRLASARLTANGSAGEADSRLTVALDAPRLAELAPLLPPRAPRRLAGALRANAEWHGDYARGGGTLKATGEALRVGAALTLATLDARVDLAAAGDGGAPVPSFERRLSATVAATGIVAPQGRFARASASAEGTLARHVVAIAFAGEDLDVTARAQGGVRDGRDAADAAAWAWTGTLDALENRGAWALRLAAPTAIEVGADRVHVGATRLDAADGRIDIGALTWDDGRLATRGSFAGVPAATAARLAGVGMPFGSTLTLAGSWSLAATPRLNGSLAVRRERGDIFVGPGAIAETSERALRITALDLSAQFRDDAVDATATLRSDRGTNADARLTIGVAPDAAPGRIGADAPLEFALTADLANLQLLQPWVGTAAIVDGNARLELSGRGTRVRAPLTGTLRANGLRIDAPQHGMHFADGRLAARLVEGTLTLEELSFAGGAGRFTASGTLANAIAMRGDGEGGAANLRWHAEKFRVFNRPDRRLVVSGSGAVELKERKLFLEGALSAEEGYFEYAADAGSALGDDVVVKGRPVKGKDDVGRETPPLAIDLELDLGEKLKFSGEGLETGLRGKLRVTTAADGRLRGRGSILAADGTYYAFGQKLVIDRGRLVFDGPLDNPGLDIVALRKNLAVEAGVAVSGTVKVPIVQLTSNPPVPDNEKLSWLVLGQGLDRTSGADVAALQAASAALLGRRGKPVTTTIAESVGLDDISVHSAAAVSRGGARGTAETSGQVVAFGKRLSDRLTLAYEQGLTVATNALRLEYALTRTLTLRAEAGTISGVGVYYRRTFE